MLRFLGLEEVWGGLGGGSGRPYVAIPGFGGSLGGGSEEVWEVSLGSRVAIPGFGGGLGGGSEEVWELGLGGRM